MNYREYLDRKHAEHGDRFDTSELSLQFVPYFENRQRIKIKNRWGEVLTGTVGVTTGWKPSFLLMRRKNQTGSSILLSDLDILL